MHLILLFDKSPDTVQLYIHLQNISVCQKKTPKVMSYLISFVFYVALTLTFFLLMPIDIQYIKHSLNQLYNLPDTLTNK